MVDIARKPEKKRRRWVLGGAALAAIVLITAALAQLEPAAPSVDGATVWRDTVLRGDMVRQVRGPGTLVPEDIRWISAVTQGRVERKLVQPGTQVTAGTILVELSNPDVERQLLEAQRQLTAALSTLATLKTNLQNTQLTQQATVATVRNQLREAERVLRATEGLAQQDMTSRQELDRARGNVEELRTRVSVEEQRLRFMTESQRSQIAAQESEVGMLRTLAAFQQRQIESMRVRAGSDGVLQEMVLEPGQWVNSGATLAKVVQPGRLKAVLRIPETQAKDITVGQPASIDTRNGIIPGRVVRVDPAAQNGTVGVDVALEGALPRGARPDLSVDGTIDIERLRNVLYVGRPAYGQAESVVGLFRIAPNGREAQRVNVRLGRSSASTIEIQNGLNAGDVVILSDMSQFENADRVRIQ
ncbi:MAG TPA: HlyD family efflux transporter periplasmic adaptor subunit [Longimicrobiaceae bacterium]|nr:HlyD family efflux transporter periplasmic adaptor subunit [Longimicrobiaceae bacterium]